LRRTFFVIGHIAVCHLNYLDCSVFGELKRRNALREQKQEKEKEKLKSSKKSKSKRRDSTRDSTASHANSPRIPRASLGFNKDDEEDDVIGAEADDAEAEYIRSVCETEIVAGGNLLSLFTPAIIEVCLNPNKYPDINLRASASLALTKFMLVSSEFCDEQLQLLFTVLERSPEPVIRANMIIAAGDLSFRFPNILEPWTPRMYACLRDDSSLVRSNTVTVLTHLILNDMIKIKGQISDMALCIMDENEKISNMAKLFFTELSRKGNKLYNVMPDIVSRLSDPANEIEEDKFKEIMKYIIGLIDKDKHSESLVEKLCHRFHATTTERQWRDIGFCLGIFNYNDKAAKKLIDNFNCYSDKLHEDSLYEGILAILTQCKKLQKLDTKQAVEEMGTRIEEARNKCHEDHMAGTRAKEAKEPKTTKKMPGKTPKRPPKGRKAAQSSSDEDNDEAEDSFHSDQEENIPKKPARKSMRKSTQKPSNAEESSDNEDFEDQDETKTKRLSNRAKGDKKSKKGHKKVLASSESEPEGDENVDETNSENTTAKKKKLSARNDQKSQNGKNSQNGKKSASSDEGSPIIQPPKSAARSSRARRIK